METRTSVALKVDQETAFYQEFFLPLKEGKTLSDFCVTLLRAYYEDAEVKAKVDGYVRRHDPLVAAKEKIQQMLESHSHTIMTLHAMKGSVDHFEREVGLEVEAGAAAVLPAPEAVKTPVEERLAVLEKALPGMMDRMDQVIAALAGTGTAPTPLSAPVAPVAAIPAASPSPAPSTSVAEAVGASGLREDAPETETEQQEWLTSAPPVASTGSAAPVESSETVYPYVPEAEPGTVPDWMVEQGGYVENEPPQKEDAPKAPSSFRKGRAAAQRN